MKSRKHIHFSLLLVFLSCFSGILNAQNEFEITLKKAFYAAQSGKHHQAIKYYEAAYQMDSTSKILMSYYAHSLHAAQKHEAVIPFYKKLILQDSLNKEIEYRSKLAECYKYLEFYQLALKEYEDYRILLIEQKNSTNENEISKCNSEIFACEYALQHPTQTLAKIEALPASINTIYSEFNPIPGPGGRLYYSSYYPIFQDTFNSLFSDMFISEIFISRLTNQGWEGQEKPSKRINNRKDHNGNLTISRSGHMLYFSRCKDDEGQPAKCQIYQAVKSGKNWTQIKALPESVNDAESSSTHPHLVETRDHDILYFTSDRKGGFGANDLYYVIIKDGKYGAASNLGSTINTLGNEVTPSYDKDNKTFYFSSDFHPGYGGYDIFKSTGGLNGWSKPKNLGKPINSSFNDLYYTAFGLNEAYIASNRKGSLHSPDAENCCNDIYHVTLPEIKDNIIEKVIELEEDTVSLSVNEQIQDLLPITLYFHNDVPDPNTRKITTDKNYKDLLSNYILLKEDYLKFYSQGLDSSKQVQARNDIHNFFKEYVEGGFSELTKLTNLLLEELEQGKNLRIVVRGYASPLNNSAYNYNLSKRRIASLTNYLRNYKEGIFIPYLETKSKDGGVLTIYEDPQGDRKAAQQVSDNPNDKRNSIYSRSAALERKIQIVRFQSDEENSQELSDFPKLTIAKDSILIEPIDSLQKKTFIIELKNEGSAELQIKKITSSGKALKYELPKNTIPSGKSVSLYLRLDGKYIQNKTTFSIDITTNEYQTNSKITIYIKPKE